MYGITHFKYWTDKVHSFLYNKINGYYQPLMFYSETVSKLKWSKGFKRHKFIKLNNSIWTFEDKNIP